MPDTNAAILVPPALEADAAPTLLRFITCGSVDDGKSTLIGRLLHEANHIADDQLQALRRDSKRHGTQGAEVDYALLVDGLSAEREQGITIDIGYRYFSTPHRRFIVADTPGHEQYTRNMATAASTASLAVLLVDARAGLMEQTRRHSLIVAMLGVRHLVLAVNKMDLAGFAQDRFDELERQYRAFAAGLQGDGPALDIVCIPISAKGGDNVALRSAAMPWYTGPTLLQHLERVDTAETAAAAAAFRMPVQWVNRPNPEFRGFAGLIGSGCVAAGDVVRVLPSGRQATVARIVTADGDLAQAQAGDAVTLTLAEDVDVSRGDILVRADEAAPLVASELTARLLWAGAEPAVARRSYLMKIGAASVPVQLDPPLAMLDVATGTMVPADDAAMPGLNAIALCGLRVDLPIVFDRYADNRDSGGFILIDRTTNMTVAMGMVERAGIAPADGPKGMRAWLFRVRERPWRSLAKAVSWRATGTVDTMILTFLVTGNVRIAASVGGLEIFTKIGLYFLHERLWARIPLGLRGAGQSKG